MPASLPRPDHRQIRLRLTRFLADRFGGWTHGQNGVCVGSGCLLYFGDPGQVLGTAGGLALLILPQSAGAQTAQTAIIDSTRGNHRWRLKQ
jgi:hypothetical protein